VAYALGVLEGMGSGMDPRQCNQERETKGS